MNSVDLELAGAVLYKCEGTKLRRDNRYPDGNVFYYAIEFTNSESSLIMLFLDFLRKILKVDESKIKCELFLYSDQDINNLTKYWEGKTKICPQNFQKAIIFKSKQSKFNPSKYGTCKIRLNDKKIFIELNKIITKRLGLGTSLIK